MKLRMANLSLEIDMEFNTVMILNDSSKMILKDEITDYYIYDILEPAFNKMIRENKDIKISFEDILAKLIFIDIKELVQFD